MGQGEKSKQKETRDLTRTQTTTGLADFTPQFRDALRGLQGFQKGATKAFSGAFNPIVQNALSQGQQNIKSAQSAGQRDLARNLSTAGSGSNSTLLNVLGNVGNQRSALAQNALVPLGLQQQREFDVADRNANIAAAQTQGNLLNTLSGLLQRRAGTTVTETGTIERQGRAKRGFSPFV